MTFQELKKTISSLSHEKAIEAITSYLSEHPDDDEALTIRGLKYWGLGKRALAINDYLAAIEINPESRAKLALKATNDILDFYNKDLFNP